MQASGKVYISHPSRSDVLRVWNFADLHIGNAAVAMDMLKRDVARVRDDPNSFFFGGGDYAECIGLDD